MKTARLIFVFGLFFGLTAGTALADDLPTFQMLMKDGRLIPARLVVPANTKFRLEVRNDNPGAAEFESYDLKKELVLAPGVTRKLVGRDPQGAPITSSADLTDAELDAVERFATAYRLDDDYGVDGGWAFDRAVSAMFVGDAA